MSTSKTFKQQGFTLIEIMIGLVIGLLATLVIYNVFNVFEQQKRATTGGSDAQTNGAIALYNLQRDVQAAGYGLPVYGAVISPFNCPVNTTIDHDGVAASLPISLSPIVITNGNGVDGSDTISIRNGDSMRGGAAVSMVAGTGTPTANVAQVNHHIGCAVGDVALVMNQPPSAPLNCNMSRVIAVSAAGVVPATVSLTVGTANVNVGNDLACLGVWNETQYSVNASNQLTRSGAVTAGVPNAAAVPLVPDIVNMQAQYGISANPQTNRIEQWVDATGAWANPTLADRNRIKAIRIAIVARNGLLGREDVTANCSSLTAANPTGLCAWDATSANPPTASPAPAINLTAADWRRYRYRVYESIIPIRSIVWSRCVLNETCP
jgi:type IV pilus assembly protein PilW